MLKSHLPKEIYKTLQCACNIIKACRNVIRNLLTILVISAKGKLHAAQQLRTLRRRNENAQKNKQVPQVQVMHLNERLKTYRFRSLPLSSSLVLFQNPLLRVWCKMIAETEALSSQQTLLALSLRTNILEWRSLFKQKMHRQTHIHNTQAKYWWTFVCKILSSPYTLLLKSCQTQDGFWWCSAKRCTERSRRSMSHTWEHLDCLGLEQLLLSLHSLWLAG